MISERQELKDLPRYSCAFFASRKKLSHFAFKVFQISYLFHHLINQPLNPGQERRSASLLSTIITGSLEDSMCMPHPKGIAAAMMTWSKGALNNGLLWETTEMHLSVRLLFSHTVLELYSDLWISFKNTMNYFYIIHPCCLWFGTSSDQWRYSVSAAFWNDIIHDNL